MGKEINGGKLHSMVWDWEVVGVAEAEGEGRGESW